MTNPTVKHDLKTAADQATEAAKHKAASLMQDGAAAVSAAGEELKDLAATARDTAATQAKARAEDGRDLLAEQTQRLADGLRQSSYGADRSSLQGRVVNTLADGIMGMSDDLRDRSVASIWADTQALARQHPGAFVAGAGLLGFAAARFLMASDDRAPRAAIGYRTGPQSGAPTKGNRS